MFAEMISELRDSVGCGSEIDIDSSGIEESCSVDGTD